MASLLLVLPGCGGSLSGQPLASDSVDAATSLPDAVADVESRPVDAASSRNYVAPTSVDTTGTTVDARADAPSSLLDAESALDGGRSDADAGSPGPDSSPESSVSTAPASAVANLGDAGDLLLTISTPGNSCTTPDPTDSTGSYARVTLDLPASELAVGAYPFNGYSFGVTCVGDEAYGVYCSGGGGSCTGSIDLVSIDSSAIVFTLVIPQSATVNPAAACSQFSGTYEAVRCP
jgi:hypothetical protein